MFIGVLILGILVSTYRIQYLTNNNEYVKFIFRLVGQFFAIAVRKVPFALMMSKFTALKLKNRFKFHIMEEPVLTYPVVFAFPKGSPYIKEFNIRVYL